MNRKLLSTWTFRLAAVAALAAGCAGSLRSSAGIDLAGMNRKVAPGDDFFGYVNGGWYERQQIPSDRAAIGIFNDLAELTAKRTADLIKDTASSDHPAGSEERKIADAYATYMDEDAGDKKGLAPLLPELARIDAINSPTTLATALGDSLRADVDVLNASHYDTPNLFGLWVAADLDQPTQYSPFLLQGGLLLPDRDFYLDGNARMATIKQKYEQHLAKLLQLAGLDDAVARAHRVVELETKLAQAHASRVETEDVEKGNNHWARADFATKAPGLDWAAYFTAAGLNAQPSFVVWQPQAVVAESALVASEPLKTWKDFLTAHAVTKAAWLTTKAMYAENFDFYGKTLSGVDQPQPRWRRAVQYTDGLLGEPVGKLYVAKYFSPAEKARAEEMVKNELAAFGRRIDKLAWMSPETKEKAKAKLATLKVGVGYPDQWRDYSGLEVVRGDILGNAQRSEKFEYAWALSKLGKPVDRGEWVMVPQLVNAVNLPVMNALNFPAAILQPPFFDSRRPALMDYGSAGAVIGHEISHSFDAQGALFDASGKLQNWWTPADFEHFKASSEALAKQYDGYSPFGDAHVNGHLTLSENIADVAGLNAAYDAYRASVGDKANEKLDGLSADQQFFVSFGQSWRNKMREQVARQRLVVDGHAPAEYRADTVRNLDAWYDAFGVQPGQKLYLTPEQRVKVW